MMPPNFGSGGGSCLPSMVVVALGEPRTPVVWMVSAASQTPIANAARRKLMPQDLQRLKSSGLFFGFGGLVIFMVAIVKVIWAKRNWHWRRIDQSGPALRKNLQRVAISSRIVLAFQWFDDQCPIWEPDCDQSIPAHSQGDQFRSRLIASSACFRTV